MEANRWVRASVLILAISETVLLGVATWTRTPLLLALGQVILLPLGALLFTAVRYAALQGRYLRDVEQRRRQAERRQIADDVHDMVGHDLSLIAMQAGLLELRTSGADARVAAALRDRAEAAVQTLHDTVNLIAEQPAHAPVTTDIARLVDHACAAGSDVTLTGRAEGPAPTRTLAAQVVREGLTNSARHSPGLPVAVHITSTDVDVEVEVATTTPTASTGRTAGRGLEAMERRLASVGGVVAVQLRGGRHILTARIPKVLERQEPRGAGGTAGRPHDVLRQVLVPLAVVLGSVLGYYSWASHNATIEPTAQARLRIGMSQAVADELVPERQAPVQIVEPPSHPPQWECLSFTNGNFPLAIVTSEVCLNGGHVVRITDLGGKPPW